MSNNVTSLDQIKQTGKMVAGKAGMGMVKQFFEHNKSAMAAVLPKHVTSERMLRIALGALRTTPKLMEATTESLMGGVMVCSQLGLEPNTVLGHAYLIPYGNRRQNRTDVQVVIGYKGLIDLARRSGQVLSLAAHAVYEKDHFDFAYGLEEKLEHKPAIGDPEGRGQIIAFYAVAKLKDGGYAFEIMSKTQVDQVRNNSQGYQSAQRYKKDHPWVSSYEEMGRKTVIRRLAKYLPLSIEFATAAAIDGMADSGRDQHLESALEGEFSIMPDDSSDNEATDETQSGDSSDPQTNPPMPMLRDLITKAADTDSLDEILDLIRDWDSNTPQTQEITSLIDARLNALSNKGA